MEKKEYIERGAVLEKNMYGNTAPITHRTYAEMLIQSAPAADVVEVVRCKNCKHSRPINKLNPPEKYFKDDCIVCECENCVGDEPMVYVPYHFCSYGERKEE